MKLYLKEDEEEPSESNRESAGPSFIHKDEMDTTRKEVYMNFLRVLEPSFSRFKKTVAFSAIYEKVLEFEDICERVYE